MTDEAKEGFVKLKMPKYYIAKHSDEDLQAAVLAEREACAKQYLEIMRDAVEQAVLREREACLAIVETHPTVRVMSIAIRARSK